MKTNKKLSQEILNHITNCFAPLGEKTKGVPKGVSFYHCPHWRNGVMSPYIMAADKISERSLDDTVKFFQKFPKAKPYDAKKPYINFMTLEPNSLPKSILDKAEACGWQVSSSNTTAEFWDKPSPLPKKKDFYFSSGIYQNGKLLSDFKKTMISSFRSKPMFLRELHGMHLIIKDRLRIVVLYHQSGQIAGGGLVATRDGHAFLYCGSIEKKYRGRGLWKMLLAARQLVSQEMGAKYWLTTTANPLIRKGLYSLSIKILSFNETLKTLLAEAAKIRKLVGLAQYGKAFKLAEALYQKYPDEPMAVYLYAVLLGDNHEGLTETQIEINRKKTVTLLKEVVQQLDRLPERGRRSALNELYWFSRKPQQQYELGKTYVAKGDNHGYYSMGVGGFKCAERAAKKGKPGEALSWAKKSVKAWESYFKLATNKYYNAWCWYARSLGVLGEYKKMEEAIHRAAKLSKRSGDYPEFINVRTEAYGTRDLIERKWRRMNEPKRPPYWFIFEPSVKAEIIKLVKISKSTGPISYCKAVQNLPRKFPKNFYANLLAHALWGDLGQCYSHKIEKRMKAQAVHRMLKLKPQMDKVNCQQKDTLLNEIAYHSGDYLGQYKLGVVINKTTPSLGYFSMGVGAAEYAQSLFEKGQFAQAQIWAQRSVEAWSAYERKWGRNHSNSSFYALALSLTGQKSKAHRILQEQKKDKLAYRDFKPYYTRLEARMKTHEDFHTKWASH